MQNGNKSKMKTIMKKNIQYLLLGVLALMSSCQDQEYVLPTAERQGITSLTALFTSGPYVDKEAVVYTIADARRLRNDETRGGGACAA